jgi:hypothetical protein
MPKCRYYGNCREAKSTVASCEMVFATAGSWVMQVIPRSHHHGKGRGAANQGRRSLSFIYYQMPPLSNFNVALPIIVIFDQAVGRVTKEDDSLWTRYHTSLSADIFKVE